MKHNGLILIFVVSLFGFNTGISNADDKKTEESANIEVKDREILNDIVERANESVRMYPGQNYQDVIAKINKAKFDANQACTSKKFGSDECYAALDEALDIILAAEKELAQRKLASRKAAQTKP